jgi:PAS domain S-box-containing protein
MTVLQTMWDKAVIVRIRARRVFVLGTVLASWLLVAAPRALALDPDLRISQYAHTAWRVRDGTFAGAPSAITQTTDGYVWIGTLAGLLRFDGVRFVPFAPPAGQHLSDPAVISLLGATDGSLWIGTADGLAQWKNGELFTFPATAGRVNSIFEDRDGTIWIARSRTQVGGVCKVSASVATCYAPKEGVPPYATGLIRDNLGFFLIGHSTGIVRWKPGSSTSYELPGLKSRPGLAGITDLALAPDGSVWVGISNPGRGLGLEQLVNSSWKTFITPTLDGSKLRVSSLRLDRHNALWIATDEKGIYRVHDGNVDRFAAADGLSSDSVKYAFEDREGDLWLTTAEGVDCFRGTPVVNFSVHEGLTADKVDSILASRDGTIWIGNHGGLDIVRGNHVSSIRPRNGLSGDRITSLFEDHAGRLWVGLDNGLFVYEHGRFTPIHRPDGSLLGIVVAMTEDIDHNVWAAVIRTPPGPPAKLICFQDGRFVKEISDQRLDASSLAADPQSGFWLGLRHGGLARSRNDQVQIFPFKNANARVSQVLTNSDGSVLAATNHGLVEQRGGNQHTLDSKNGLPCNRIYALVTDKHSDLWLYAECGLIEIKSDDVQRWRTHPDHKVSFELFDAFDGAQPFIPPFSPVAARSNDGRLWFANETVAQMIDPDGLLRNSIPPPVHIEDVITDRKVYSLQSGLRLPALTRDLEIDYTALSFVVPQKVLFRYKLEGYDREWQNAGTRRQAFYSNLPPRSYTFRVKACNNSGLWNEAGASLDFIVAPAYYQTVWFRSLGVFLFLAGLTGLYRLRLRHLERQRDALRKSEKELRDVIDTIAATVWSALPDGSNTYVNKHFVEYSGLSAEQTAGSGWQAAIHPDDLERHAGKWMEAIATGKLHESEARFRRSDGQYRWHLDRGVPLRDEDGNIVKWYGVVTDIEDRKRAEEALEVLSRDLQESKAKLEAAQRITHVGYWEWDILTGRVNWSDETYRIYGLQPQEGPMDLATVREKIDPEDWRRGMEEALGRASFNAECRLFRPTGEMRIAHFQGDVNRDASGRPYRMFGTIQDITDRKHAEEALQQSQCYLAEGQRLAHMGSWAFNPSGFFEHWSQELFKIYGLDPHKGAPTLEQYLATVHPQDRDFMAETIKRMHAERSGCDVKKRIVRPDGELRYIRCVGIPVVEGEGLKGFLGTAIDITEQELLTRELELRQAHLAEAQKLTHTGSWAWHLPDRNAVEVSEEWYRIYGFDPAEGAPTWEEFLERVHPEDRLKWSGITERAVVEKADCGQEFRILLPNGKVKWIRTVGHPVLSNTGDLEQFVGSSTDITELKSAEQERERLRQLEADLAHTNRVSTLGEMAASLAHEIKQPIAAAITSANSCIEWLAHEPPNLDRARAAAARIDKYGNRAAEIIERIRSFYKKSPPQRELVDVNGIIQEILTLLDGEACRYSVAMRTELAAELPKIMADRVQLQQVFMNLMFNAIEAMKDSGGELTVKSQLQDGQLQFSVSDTGVGLPTEEVDQMFSAFFTTKPQGSGMGLAISRSIVESHGGRLWAAAHDGRGAIFHFTLPTRLTESSPLVA